MRGLAVSHVGTYVHTIDIHMQVYTGKATPFTE